VSFAALIALSRVSNTITPDRITADEIRRAFEQINTRLDQLTETVTTITQGIQHAADATPPTQAETKEMIVLKMTRKRESGKWYYRMLGPLYPKRGIAIWSEGLEALEIDAEKLEWKDDDSYTFPKPIKVIMKMHDHKFDDGETKNIPQKVTGKA